MSVASPPPAAAPVCILTPEEILDAEITERNRRVIAQTRAFQEGNTLLYDLRHLLDDSGPHRRYASSLRADHEDRCRRDESGAVLWRAVLDGMTDETKEERGRGVAGIAAALNAVAERYRRVGDERWRDDDIARYFRLDERWLNADMERYYHERFSRLEGRPAETGLMFDKAAALVTGMPTTGEVDTGELQKAVDMQQSRGVMRKLVCMLDDIWEDVTILAPAPCEVPTPSPSEQPAPRTAPAIQKPQPADVPKADHERSQTPSVVAPPRANDEIAGMSEWLGRTIWASVYDCGVAKAVDTITAMIPMGDAEVKGQTTGK